MARFGHLAAVFLLATVLAMSLSCSSAMAAKTPRSLLEHQGRRLTQASATAIANAVSTGGTAVSTSDSGAVSTDGTPASSTVISSSTAQDNQTVIAECSNFAVNTESYKVCVGRQQSPPPSAGTWASTQTCVQKPPTASSPADKQGRLWGFENGQNCVYRSASGSAITKDNLSEAVLTSSKNITFDTAPACTGNVKTAYKTSDDSGRLWGFENNAPCAYKDKQGKPIY